MRTLAVADGDLVLSGGDYYTISGPTKIKQDLTFALNDMYGSDRYHPFWGSILDQFLGKPLNAALQQQVISEVTRVLNNYVSVQTDQINQGALYDIKGVYDTSDVVRSVENISAVVNYDRINISVSLQTMARETVVISRQVNI